MRINFVKNIIKGCSKKKSLFGFRILKSNESIFFAYTLIIIRLVFQLSYFYYGARNNLGLISMSLFLIIVNTSVIILSINSILQKINFNKYIWFLFNLMLWIYIPILIMNSFNMFRVIFSIIKNY